MGKERNTTEIEVSYTTKSDGWNNGFIVPKGIVLHSTAWPGKDARYIRDYFDAPNRGASIHAAVDDRRAVQCLPWTKKAGHVGRGSRGTLNSTHIGVEMCEPSGLVYDSSGSIIVRYEPAPGYFQKVWKNAAALFAMLCRRFGLDPMGDGVILSHAEAHARGYGDNHADTAHWFRWEGVTMDDFRAAVRDMKGEEAEEEMSYEQFVEYMDRYMSEAVKDEPDAWAKEAAEKAVARGIVQGDGSGAFNWHKPLTREAYVVMQDRAGLL